MSRSGTGIETEIKLRIASPAAIVPRLEQLGFRVTTGRSYEDNLVFDTPDAGLRDSQRLLRLRTFQDHHWVTFKGPPVEGPHKSREETEVAVDDPQAMRSVFERLGFAVSFRYEKYRTEYSADRAGGVVCLDETPIGTFLELEGTSEWIDRTAGALGFRSSDYITRSYGALYLDYCRDRGIQPSHMVFAPHEGL